ncbi:probable vacuolar amino acid transporter YPQ3 [Trichomonascus vanleenenianus]|uniref:PQ-loop repeat-containing protein n=1 Tax=Trichomonascus vanleenenianus TaxID=2268995 RepID=UPI003EC988B4
MIEPPTVPNIPPHRVAISNIAGSTSLACWIVLLLPQMIEQWRCETADGIAIGFLIIWVLGDITNLAGAIWACLLPEVILLAVWYCMADILILSSYFYYKHKARRRLRALQHHQHHHHHNHNHVHPAHEHDHQHEHGAREGAEASSAHARTESLDNDPTQPLLNRRNSASRKSHTRRRDSLNSVIEAVEDPKKGSVWTRIVLPVLFVFAAGAFGYAVSGSPESQPPQDGNHSWGAQVMGYISATLYLGARLPQIYQNHKRRSVYGLSLLFFIFSTMGNLTYALSILVYRYDRAWIQLNFPWLLGSLGTIIEDVVIFIQFYVYQGQGAPEEGSAITE